MFRWWAVVVLFSCVGISAYYRARARRESGVIPRRSEGGLVLAGRAIGALAILSTILAHAFVPASMGWASFESLDWAPWAGAFLGLLAIPGAYWVMSSLGRNVSETVLTKQGQVLITQGPYRWVRHPLYAVGITLIAAIGLMVKSWLIVLFAALALVIFRFFVIPAEERRLVEKFPETYGGYMRRTGRLLPRLRAVRTSPAR